jgi:hypothetical protein
VTNVVSLPIGNRSAARDPLNPAQHDVLAVLGASRESWPTFRPELRDELLAALDAELGPITDRLPAAGDKSPSGAALWLSKHVLSDVLGCEARFLHDDAAGFPGWSVPLARGTVAHKAIELSIHMRTDPEPTVLVDEALARLADAESPLADWLQRRPETERAELRAAVSDLVAKFLETWPRLKPAWWPVTESTWRAELAGGRVVLIGRADLTLQRAEGNVARKIVVDLKTGGFAPHHLDDLRFYALIETLRLGTPPRLVASYYLDSGRFVPEKVTEAGLWSAAARVVGAADRLVELRAGRVEPVYRPGPACRWCPLVDGCEAATSVSAAGEGWG